MGVRRRSPGYTSATGLGSQAEKIADGRLDKTGHIPGRKNKAPEQTHAGCSEPPVCWEMPPRKPPVPAEKRGSGAGVKGLRVSCWKHPGPHWDKPWGRGDERGPSTCPGRAVPSAPTHTRVRAPQGPGRYPPAHSSIVPHGPNNLTHSTAEWRGQKSQSRGKRDCHSQHVWMSQTKCVKAALLQAHHHPLRPRQTPPGAGQIPCWGRQLGAACPTEAKCKPLAPSPVRIPALPLTQAGSPQ